MLRMQAVIVYMHMVGMDLCGKDLGVKVKFMGNRPILVDAERCGDLN